MKLIVIILIEILSIVVAVNYIRAIKMHIKTLNQCVLMIENIEILLSYKSLSVKEIFNNLSNNDSLNCLEFIKKINNSMLTEKSVYILSDENKEFILNNKYINYSDKENLISFFSVFGKSDLNGQLLNCKTYKEIFKNSLKKDESTEQKDCKSIGTLILGIGILLAILIY